MPIGDDFAWYRRHAGCARIDAHKPRDTRRPLGTTEHRLERAEIRQIDRAAAVEIETGTLR